jgi:hypothetical protein
MKHTIEQFAKAFAAWENGYRSNPTEYLTPEEVSEIDVSQLSADRATYFHQLLQELE